MPVIEQRKGVFVAFLEGEPGPQIESQNGFRIDGVEIKVRLDFGAGFVDRILGSHTAVVDRDRLRAAVRDCPAEPFESTLLDRAQELGLVKRRKLANLVQKQRALAGKLELSCFALSRAGERATLIAEELALEQTLGNAWKIDRDHRERGPLSP